MSEEKKQSTLGELNRALEDIPEQYRGEVVRNLTHDAGVIARTIRMTENRGA